MKLKNFVFLLDEYNQADEVKGEIRLWGRQLMIFHTNELEYMSLGLQ